MNVENRLAELGYEISKYNDGWYIDHVASRVDHEERVGEANTLLADPDLTSYQRAELQAPDHRYFRFDSCEVVNPDDVDSEYLPDGVFELPYGEFATRRAALNKLKELTGIVALVAKQERPRRGRQTGKRGSGYCNTSAVRRAACR